MSKENFLVVLSQSDIENIEREQENLWEMKSCDDFHVIQDNEKKTISIVPQINGSFLKLSKDKAKVLAAIIQDCVTEW